MYTKEEVRKKTLEYFKGDDLATDVWISKYCLKDRQGNLLELTPQDMHNRLAFEFYRIERKYLNPMKWSEITELFDHFKYVVPGGSQMAGIGNDTAITSLSNCFVIGSAIDSYGGIFNTDQEQVQLMKRRGGVGHDLSNLRPSGVSANNAILGDNAGATLYMERFSNSTREVAQDGRRGALMLSIDVRHPDCDKFIDSKLKEGKVTGANISVRISDEFMKVVEENGDFIQSFPVYLDIGFDSGILSEPLKYNVLYKGALGYYKKIKARELWNKIIKNAHQSAEPGVLFWDTIIRESPADCYGEEWKSVSTNPCGEIPLCAYDSCRLTSINLYSYVNDPFTDKASFDYELFKNHVNKAQRLMDDTVDLEIEKIDKILDKVEKDPEQDEIKLVEFKLWLKIRQKAVEGRRTGLGVTAEGDMLAALGLRFGTKEATEFSVNIHRITAIESYKSSIQLAKERGSFTVCNYKTECYNPFIDRVIFDEILHNELTDYITSYQNTGRRNISNLTCAPAGTVSLMTQTTSGIEPLFKPFYKRKRKVETETDKTTKDKNGDIWEEYFVIHPKFVEWYKVKLEEDFQDFQIWYDGLSFEYIDVRNWLSELDEKLLNTLFEHSLYYKATANDIDWKESVRMQGEIQKWIDHSISKTVNLPFETTVEQVDELYRLAWKSGCKGITIYREGSREGIMTSIEKKKENFDYLSSIVIPKERECDIYHKTALKKNWMIVVGKVNGKPVEIFAFEDLENHIFPSSITKGVIKKEKSRVYSLTSKYSEKIYRIPNIIDLINDHEGNETIRFSLELRHKIDPLFVIKQIRKYASITSFDKVIEITLMNYVKEDKIRCKDVCPECGSELTPDSGCVKCLNCGWSKCG